MQTQQAQLHVRQQPFGQAGQHPTREIWHRYPPRSLATPCNQNPVVSKDLLRLAGGRTEVRRETTTPTLTAASRGGTTAELNYIKCRVKRFCTSGYATHLG